MTLGEGLRIILASVMGNREAPREDSTNISWSVGNVGGLLSCDRDRIPDVLLVVRRGWCK